MKARKLSDAEICEVEGCEDKVAEIVWSRKLESVILCCEYHSDIIVDEGHPEYEDYCNNCGCRQGVN